MDIKTYISEFTSGERIYFNSVLAEVGEFFEAMTQGDRKGMSEEFGDVVHFFQLWLFWRFKINGEIWRGSKKSVEKFMARVKVWRSLYVYVGLDPKVSNFCGNYKKIDKVVKQLGRYGISRTKAEEAYRAIVQK